MSGWKIAELIRRFAEQDPYDLCHDEMQRVAGRLEGKGFQSVEVDIEQVDDSTLSVSVSAKCPCGADKLACVEKWPLDMFRDGPSALEARVLMIEQKMLGRLKETAK